MPAPLLAVDAPSLLYRAFFALPDSIKDPEGQPVNALLGTANLLLQAVEEHRPRAVVLCFGAEAATYRTDAFAGYHADRPPMPDALGHQWKQARAFFGAFGWSSLDAGELEADDLLGSLAALERDAGGRALLFTGDRDMFQCVDGQVAVLWPAGKGSPEVVDAAGVRERYGIEPAQVPDFIALRGDPSDGIPGAKGIGEKGAAQLLRDHGGLEALISLAGEASAVTRRLLRPKVAETLRLQAGELRAYKDMATLRTVATPRPPDAPGDFAGAAAAARAKGMNRLGERLERAAAAA
ncbi:MAG: DNA polymerase I [uncultured Solirubrobacteraceae bacterium]|uniref:5'-3' exonuclease n=1 Tax=uncultured Solirubrobacteraceae bacterium TaxID=1162706 RepID=A0A6J4RN05_9ACTN|nr:MAG: DNA polymerase I [uncultured Solirubrobacteraceae bacterium]